MTLMGVLILSFAATIIIVFGRLLWREDEAARTRPHPGPDEGGRSFGDTTHWGGMGRPGS